MDYNAQQRSLTIKTLRLRLNRVMQRSISETKFVPKDVTFDMKKWLLSLQMSGTEKQIVSSMVREILMEHERRLRWVQQELDSEVFKRFGGD